MDGREEIDLFATFNVSCDDSGELSALFVGDVAAFCFGDFFPFSLACKFGTDFEESSGISALGTGRLSWLRGPM